MIKDSTNQHISFLMLSATDGSTVNTGTTYVAICKDGGGPVTATNSPAHKSNGAWTLDLSQAETNCDHLLAVMTISGAITAMVQVYPVDPASFKADVSSLATSTDISDIKGAGWSSSTDTLALIRDRVDLDITLTAGTQSTVNTINGVTTKLDTTWQVNGAVYKFTTDALSNGPTDGSAPSAADIYTEFTTGSNADAFKANVTSLATGAEIAALNDTTPQEVWDALTSGSYALGSFGERLLRSTNQQAEVAVTGSNHVAADIHELQNDVITAVTIDATAITEIQTGLATATELLLVPKTGTAYTHTNQAGDTMTVTIT